MLATADTDAKLENTQFDSKRQIIKHIKGINNARKIYMVLNEAYIQLSSDNPLYSFWGLIW